MMKAVLNLDIASIQDFIRHEKGERKRKLGMPYFLLNQLGELECYELSEHTNSEELRQFISEERCFVIKERGKIKN